MPVDRDKYVLGKGELTEEQIIKRSKKDPNVIYLLKTDRAGEEVDNMMGVEFELKPYAVIVLGHRLFSPDNVMVLTSREDPEQIEDMLHRLKGDGYKVIYQNEAYKYPDEPVTRLERIDTDISFTIKKTYNLRISHEELNKYYKSRKDPSTYKSDLFNYLVEKNKEAVRGFSKDRFISGQIKLEEVFFNGDDVIFQYSCKMESSKNINGIPSRFENHKLFKQISDYIDNKVGGGE